MSLTSRFRDSSGLPRLRVSTRGTRGVGCAAQDQSLEYWDGISGYLRVKGGSPKFLSSLDGGLYRLAPKVPGEGSR